MRRHGQTSTDTYFHTYFSAFIFTCLHKVHVRNQTDTHTHIYIYTYDLQYIYIYYSIVYNSIYRVISNIYIYIYLVYIYINSISHVVACPGPVWPLPGLQAIAYVSRNANDNPPCHVQRLSWTRTGWGTRVPAWPLNIKTFAWGL